MSKFFKYIVVFILLFSISFTSGVLSAILGGPIAPEAKADMWGIQEWAIAFTELSWKTILELIADIIVARVQDLLLRKLQEKMQEAGAIITNYMEYLIPQFNGSKANTFRDYLAWYYNNCIGFSFDTTVIGAQSYLTSRELTCPVKAEFSAMARADLDEVQQSVNCTCDGCFMLPDGTCSRSETAESYVRGGENDITSPDGQSAADLLMQAGEVSDIEHAAGVESDLFQAEAAMQETLNLRATSGGTLPQTNSSGDIIISKEDFDTKYKEMSAASYQRVANIQNAIVALIRALINVAIDWFIGYVEEAFNDIDSSFSTEYFQMQERVQDKAREESPVPIPGMPGTTDSTQEAYGY